MTASLRVAMALGALGTLGPAQAELFENSYLSFRLPDGWSCKREETDWVCVPPTPGKKAAIAIMTAKFKGPDDTLAAYMSHLSGLPSTKQGVSTVTAPHQRSIKGIVWIDGTFLNSEIKGYYTRYMATVDSGIAVLYTFSFSKSRFSEFNQGSDFAVANLTLKPLPRTSK